MKKKTKKKIVKGSLCLIASFLLIFIGLLDSSINKENISLIAYTDNNLFTNIKEDELINILESSTGVFLIVNSKKDINRYIDLLYEVNNKEHIYLYNIKNDEMILELDEDDEINIVQKPSNTYRKLIKYLGAFTENYTLINENNELIETGYSKIYTPMVVFIKNGNVLSSHYISNKDITDTELIDIYKSGFLMIEEYSS